MPHVLIIDDEPGIRFALKRWFERQQWRVQEAEDGQAALDALLASPAGDDSHDGAFHLIVCDLNLPTVSGDAIVRTLREQRPDLAARLILTTGDAVIDAPPGSVLANHPHVLQKPFDLGTLREAVGRIAANGN